MASIQEMQQQLLQSYEQISSLSQEIANTKNELATAIQQVTFIDQDRMQKDIKLRELEQAVVSLAARPETAEAGTPAYRY